MSSHQPPTHGPGLLQPTVQPTAPYSSRPPSPPPIHVPPAGTSPPTTLTNPYHPPTATSPAPSARPSRATTPVPQAAASDAAGSNKGPAQIVMTIHPSPWAVHTTGLSPQELHAITGDAAQSARDESAVWRYESRRHAQVVLEDFLWLGPAGCVKDRAFLEKAGVTMVLCARDARFVAAGSGGGGGGGGGGGAGGGEGMLVTGVKRMVAGMGIVVDAVDVADGRELVGAFTVAAGMVNRHLLQVLAESEGRRKGCVLLMCETGNDRSAAVAASYLMAMYGLDTVAAVQFVQLRRFCVALGDDLKFRLRAYEDILRARGVVGASGQVLQQHQQQQQQQLLQPQQAQHMGGLSAGTGIVGTGRGKRGIEDMMNDDEVGGDGDAMAVDTTMDEERYVGRSFAPFVERG